MENVFWENFFGEKYFPVFGRMKKEVFNGKVFPSHAENGPNGLENYFRTVAQRSRCSLFSLISITLISLSPTRKPYHFALSISDLHLPSRSTVTSNPKKTLENLEIRASQWTIYWCKG